MYISWAYTQLIWGKLVDILFFEKASTRYCVTGCKPQWSFGLFFLPHTPVSFFLFHSPIIYVWHRQTTWWPQSWKAVAQCTIGSCSQVNFALAVVLSWCSKKSKNRYHSTVGDNVCALWVVVANGTSIHSLWMGSCWRQWKVIGSLRQDRVTNLRETHCV